MTYNTYSNISINRCPESDIQLRIYDQKLSIKFQTIGWCWTYVNKFDFNDVTLPICHEMNMNKIHWTYSMFRSLDWKFVSNCIGLWFVYLVDIIQPMPFIVSPISQICSREMQTIYSFNAMNDGWSTSPSINELM